MTGRQLDDVNGRLASIGKGTDMKQDLVRRNQTRITELLREVRCVLADHRQGSQWHQMLQAAAYCEASHVSAAARILAERPRFGTACGANN